MSKVTDTNKKTNQTNKTSNFHYLNYNCQWRCAQFKLKPGQAADVISQGDKNRKH